MDSEQKVNDDQEQVKLDEHEPSNFLMFPHFILDIPEITPSAIKLYLHYKRVCEWNKKRSCWMSLKTISEHCNMSKQTIIKTRDLLEKLKLISIIRKRSPNGSMNITIKVLNVWKRNHAECTKKPSTKNRLSEQNPSIKNGSGLSKNWNSPCLKNGSDQVQKMDPIINKETSNTEKNKTKRITHTGSGRSVHLGFAPLGKNEIKKEITYGDVVTDQLYHSLLKNRKITNKKTNIEAWTSTINHFIKTSIITMEEFDEVLDWFIVHMNERFTPKSICCAKSFCEKFVKISEAMTRSNYTEKPKTQYEELMEKFEEREMAGSI